MPEHVDERAAGVADGVEDLLQAAARVVLDDDAGARAEIRLDEGVRATRVARRGLDVGVVETPRHRAAFDDEFDFKTRRQDFVEHPDDQFVLTDGEAPHQIINPRLYAPARSVPL